MLKFNQSSEKDMNTKLLNACSAGNIRRVDSIVIQLENVPKDLEEQLAKENTAGWFPLLSASNINPAQSIGILNILLKAGANINQSSSVDQTTALYTAAYYGYLEVVNALLAHDGIDANLQCNTGETALDSAMENGHSEMAARIRI